MAFTLLFSHEQVIMFFFFIPVSVSARLSLSLCLSLPVKGLIVRIAEAAASLMGALEEYVQELHNKTSRRSCMCLLRGLNVIILNKTRGKLLWFWPEYLIMEGMI